MKRIVAVCILFVLLGSALATATFAAGKITVSIELKVDPGHHKGPYFVSCTHYYSVSQNGEEVIPVTYLPDNEVTKVELQKSKDNYIVYYYYRHKVTSTVGDGELKRVEIDPIEVSGSKNSTVNLFAGLGHGTIKLGGNGFSIVNTLAGAVAGAVTILVTFVAAAAGAAPAGEDKNKGGVLSMEIYKDFGDKIKYNADTVYVYAKIIETSPDGGEIARPDLTGNIQIFSENPRLLEVSNCVMSGEYMSAGVIAGTNATENSNTNAVISFRLTSDGGTFQNNVTFKVVGEAFISLEGEKLFLLATSGRSFEMPYELVNFIKESDDVTVRPMNFDDSFELSLGVNKDNQTVIIGTDKATNKPIERLFDSFACEIIAKNDKEHARTVFYTVMCYEGVVPDFLGKEKEIIAYKNSEDEMPQTDVAFRMGLWNEEKKTLDLSRPGEEIEIEFTDEKGISELIGLENEFNIEKSTDEYLISSFRSEKSLPSTSAVTGEIKIKYPYDNKVFESSTFVKLMPDLQTYEKNWQKEYDNCVKIIETYLPPEFRSKKLQQLNESKNKMGITDLQAYRRNCWEMASRFIMQEKEDYLIASYWYDEAIATAELLVYVGDIALDVALTPFGGPIAGFVISQVKSALIELISMRIERGTIGYKEMSELVTGRLVQAAGQADGLIETPGFDKPKVLVAWLSCYILYRIMYHWYFDEDENGNPKGLTEAIKNGLMDFAGKGASILLGEYAKDIAKKRGIDVGSTADAEQKLVNDKVRDAAKTGLDAMDKVADPLDKKINEFTETLLDFIERIRSGGIQFT